MANNGRVPLSPAKARELGEQRETWCAVELKKEQSWCRKERKHCEDRFRSTVFDVEKPVDESRCTFTVDAPTHKQRRHYDNIFQSQIII